MTTETAFIVNLQHEYLRDAHVRIASCLQALPDLVADPDGVLRLHWQTTHALKGEAQVVGFQHLSRYFEVIEDGLGSVDRALGVQAGGALGGDAQGRAPRALGTHAAARLASALREACYGIEDYLRALEREYTDDDVILARVMDSALALAGWTPEDLADWGMEPAPRAEPASDAHASDADREAPAVPDSPTVPEFQVPSLGDGIVFDPDVFSRHKGGVSAAAASVPSPLMGSVPAPTAPASSPSCLDAATSGASTGVAAACATPTEATPVNASAVPTMAAPPAQAPLPSVHGPNGTLDVPHGEGLWDQGHELYLVVMHDGLGYALPLGQVVEIVEARAWNPLPLPKRNILGVINLRGSVLPVCDFHGILGHVAVPVPATVACRAGESTAQAPAIPSAGARTNAQSNARCIVVVSVRGRRFGVPVQAVANVAEIPWGRLTALEASGLATGAGVVTHTALVEGRTMLVVDMGRMVA